MEALAAAVVAFFLVWGLNDGRVSAFNILLWLALLCGVGMALGLAGAERVTFIVRAGYVPAISHGRLPLRMAGHDGKGWFHSGWVGRKPRGTPNDDRTHDRQWTKSDAWPVLQLESSPCRVSAMAPLQKQDI